MYISAKRDKSILIIIFIIKFYKLGVVLHICNPSTQGGYAGRSELQASLGQKWVQGWPELCLTARPCPQNKT